MADTEDIEPNRWRAEREITVSSENTVRTIISSLLQLLSRLSTYVSNEDMENVIFAAKAFDSRQMDIDELLVVIQEARQKAGERLAIRKRSLEDLQQTLSVSSDGLYQRSPVNYNGKRLLKMKSTDLVSVFFRFPMHLYILPKVP
ncbi:unnamed protein product [Calicophoron daubneyi]|uniref:Uncharacterized protein n=1 Tax=Calicophoron daubneyi TaxID=300641 RepID=A0AAV2TED7_CALDB